MIEKIRKTKRETVCIGVYISTQLHDEIQKIAAEMKRKRGVRHTISDIVRLALNEFIIKNR